MDNEVVFLNLACGASFSSRLDFVGGRLIPDPRSSTSRPDRPGVRYQNVIAIGVDVSSYTDDPANVQLLLISAYLFVIDVLTAIAGHNQAYAYLEKPIRCDYQGVRYILINETFEEETIWSKTLVVHGSDGYSDDITFLNRRRNPRRILHFYREARDETNPIDYRALQLWRFFEGWYGMRDQQLIDALVALEYCETHEGFDVHTHRPIIRRMRITRRSVTSFYRYYRSAVAHGGGERRGHTRKIYYPRLLQFYSDIWMRLFFMLHVAGEILRRNPARQ